MPDTKSSPKYSKSQRIVISLCFSLLIFCLCGATAWGLDLMAHMVAVISISMLLSLITGLISYWLLSRSKKKAPTNNQDKILLKKRQKLLVTHFYRMMKLQNRKKMRLSRYDLPIYFFLSQDPKEDKRIISQMGYEAYKLDDFGNDIEFPILFWQSEHSILMSISLGEDQHPEYIKTLCKCLNKWRPRQAINGLLLATDISTVLTNEEQVTQKADELKSTLQTFNYTFGLNLPIYNVITNMGSISDFCQFFSSFDESKRNDVLGATSPYQQHGGIDAQWFYDEFDHLTSQLISNVNTALGNQLNQEFRNSIVSAPFQFGLLKQHLWLFLQRLYRGEQLSDGLQFRGFYFTHNGTEQNQKDILASVVNHSLGNDEYFYHPQIPVNQTLFSQHLMTHVVLNEQELVGVNKRRENTLLLAQTFYSLFWAGILVATLTLIKFNFDDQSQRELRADQLLERYKEAISASPYDIENMADNVPNLYSLYRIYALYTEPKPWYSLPFLPNPSIKEEVESAYFNELKQVLIPSMENTLEKDLFVYVNLEDQSKTLTLLNNYRLLFNPNRTNVDELKSYFIHTLQEQGEADNVNTAQLSRLLNDVFDQNLIPVKPNVGLESLAKKVINQTGVEMLLYEHIVNLDKFSKRVDISSELGSNFDQVFSFSPQFVGYLVPYIYTPSGFNEIDLSVESALVKEAIDAYQGIAGSAPSALEMYRISRDLKQMYQQDYINYWRSVVQNIQANSITEPSELHRVVTLLATPSENPLSQLYTTLAKYTSVEIESPPVTDDQDVIPEQDSDKTESARQISLAFASIHTLVTPDKANNKPIDSVLTAIENSYAWLDKFYKSNEPQTLAFQTLSASLKADNPISTMANIASEQPDLMKKVLNEISNQSNEMLLSLTHEYLNSSWTSEVYQPYQNTLAAFYPFNKKSTNDASVADVFAFFSNNGIFDTFYATKLKMFTTSDNASPFLAGLLPSSGLALDPDLWQMVSKAKDIQQALFLADPSKISVQFQIKAVDMTPDLTEFAITNQKTIFTYRHGPTFWSQHTWAGAEQLEDALGVKLSAQAQSVAQEEFSGNWNWFRLIEPRVKSATSQKTQIQFNYDDSKVTIAIRTQGQVNPFVPGFFAGFSLPSAI
ncbi:type VI secretion system membrane subunit TssM [Vibrio sp. ZSDE26]|uniref:Type VI secretion system membrane subunit TssM n=1 Tax=Vibrio amylolyticus TaxID=2847292 RepID=A0A9X1XT72_9VIBR|nr:type VI secretion system membrane subunit TssM [Vibrio amylolyticus]MCK6265149.1 type VI secretion system membrane subunit TssM [Vibrio amylolyticus]